MVNDTHDLLKVFETYEDANVFVEKSLPEHKDHVFILPLDECMSV